MVRLVHLVHLVHLQRIALRELATSRGGAQRESASPHVQFEPLRWDVKKTFSLFEQPCQTWERALCRQDWHVQAIQGANRTVSKVQVQLELPRDDARCVQPFRPFRLDLLALRSTDRSVPHASNHYRDHVSPNVHRTCTGQIHLKDADSRVVWLGHSLSDQGGRVASKLPCCAWVVYMKPSPPRVGEGCMWGTSGKGTEETTLFHCCF